MPQNYNKKIRANIADLPDWQIYNKVLTNHSVPNQDYLSNYRYLSRVCLFRLVASFQQTDSER